MLKFIPFIFFSYFFVLTLNAQGLFINGDFENFSSCPNSSGQIYKVNGVAPCSVTPDYYNCAFMPDDVFWCYSGITASTGTGFIGFFGSPWNSTSSQYETAVLTLDNSTIAGNTYEIKFDLYGGNATSSPCSNVLNSPCMQFGFYFYKSTNPVDCPVSSPFPSGTHPAPNASIEATSVTYGSWTSYTLTYTADDVYDRVLFGFFPNMNTCTSGCTGSDPKSYFYMDNLCIDVSGGGCINCPYVIDASTDLTICSGNSASLNASSQGGVLSTDWSTNGDGTFSDQSLLNPVYTPGPIDISNGSTILTITTDDPSGACTAISDDILITITTSMDATITTQPPLCSNNSPVILSAANAGGTWSGIGITNSITGEFSPSEAGYGSWNINYSIDGSCGTSDDIQIDVIESYTVNAGSDITICNGSNASISAVSTGGVQGTSWSTSGDGSFENDLSATTTYFPGLNDVANGEVTLTISTDNPGSPCSSVTDTILINIIGEASVNIIPQDDLCVNDGSVTLTASVSGGNWSGSGIIDSINGIFSPSLAGVGSWDIIYSYGICGNSDTTIIVVLPLENAEFTYGETSFCLPSNDAIPFISGTDNGVFTISDPGIIDSLSGQINLEESGLGQFTITYTTNGQCPQNSMEIIEICSESSVVIPNVITSNNDGVNEYFTLTVQGISSIKGIIINRWGNQITTFNVSLESNQNSVDLWDGRNETGQIVSSGVYFYLLQITDNTGKTDQYEGAVQVFTY